MEAWEIGLLIWGLCLGIHNILTNVLPRIKYKHLYDEGREMEFELKRIKMYKKYKLMILLPFGINLTKIKNLMVVDLYGQVYWLAYFHH